MFLEKKNSQCINSILKRKIYSTKALGTIISTWCFWSKSPGLWLFRFNRTCKCWLKLEAKFPTHQSDVALGLTTLELTGESSQRQATRLGSADSSALVTGTWSWVWKSHFTNPNSPVARACDPQAGWKHRLGVPLLSSPHSRSALSAKCNKPLGNSNQAK